MAVRPLYMQNRTRKHTCCITQVGQRAIGQMRTDLGGEKALQFLQLRHPDVCVCVYVYAHIYIYICIYLSICVCVCVCLSVYVYMHVYIYFLAPAWQHR